VEKHQYEITAGWRVRLEQQNRTQPLRIHNGTLNSGAYQFPDAEYRLLDAMQSARKADTLKLNFYDLLYHFRRFQCTDPADRIFGFLGLVTPEQRGEVLVTYEMSLAELYQHTARSLIAQHKHLLILKCKRESHEDALPYQQTRLFSTLDQGAFRRPSCNCNRWVRCKPRATDWLAKIAHWMGEDCNERWYLISRS
jgi:hypothetical protein